MIKFQHAGRPQLNSLFMSHLSRISYARRFLFCIFQMHARSHISRFFPFSFCFFLFYTISYILSHSCPCAIVAWRSVGAWRDNFPQQAARARPPSATPLRPMHISNLFKENVSRCSSKTNRKRNVRTWDLTVDLNVNY